MSEVWTPNSWRNFAALHQPHYEDVAALERARAQLQAARPLVSADEILDASAALTRAHAERGFVLQLGDCAETFESSTAELVRAQASLIASLGDVLQSATHRPVVRLARIAGQWAKPRSSSTETRDGITLPNYFGDLVNGPAFSPDARRSDPARLMQGVALARTTLDALRDTSGVYASHEALHLDYESAFVRADERGAFAHSAHALWIGERTREIDGAHVELLRGVRNPLGIKLGPNASANDVRALIATLAPSRASGTLMLVTRLGHANVASRLPEWIAAAGDEPVTWLVDPMHGNTERDASQRKLRRMTDMLAEIERTAAVHRAAGSHLSGLHLEITAESTHECVEPGHGIEDCDAPPACDPRCNAQQARRLVDAFANLVDR